MSNPAIALRDVSLWRRTQEEFSYDLKQTILSFVNGKYRTPAKRLILNHINIEIQPGDKVGIIGSNGAGKSTLLKVICGILQPTSGEVVVQGEIAPLIELGAGFDEKLSVEDNIVLYGVLLGFSRREMSERTQGILEFAELESSAQMPVKSLSSGMVARLGFAIATDVQPSILILDEVLSVGDERFKQKCRQRLERFWQANVTVLVVSHDLEYIQQSCQNVLWLDQGKVAYLGPAPVAIDHYYTAIQTEV